MKKYFLIILIAFPFALNASTVVNVRAGSETINAIEGTLVLPANAVVREITTGNSAVLIWIKSPSWDPKDRTISFSGLSPGGFSGTQPIFTLELSSGLASYAGGRLSGYRNDGLGTEIALEYSFSTDVPKEDAIPPEPFTLPVSSSPDLFEGQYFISFAAQDKGMGVAKYEYASTWLFSPKNNVWEGSNSPLVLSQSMLFKKIYIRATDKAGNFRVMSTVGPYRYYLILFGAIMLLCVLSLLRRSFQSRSQ